MLFLLSFLCAQAASDVYIPPKKNPIVRPRPMPNIVPVQKNVICRRWANWVYESCVGLEMEQCKKLAYETGIMPIVKFVAYQYDRTVNQFKANVLPSDRKSVV